MSCKRTIWLAVAGLAMLPAATSAGTVTYDVNLNTSTLQGAGGTFSLDFQLNDGSGTGDGNNTVTIGNFSFGAGGGLLGTMPFPSSGGIDPASNLSGLVGITDSSGLGNEFAQDFTPGSSLSFRVTLTTNADAAGPGDEFIFGLLNNGATITTNAPDGLGFVEVTIGPGGLSEGAFSTSNDLSGFDVSAPEVQQESAAVPEPVSLSLALVGLTVLGVRRLWRR